MTSTRAVFMALTLVSAIPLYGQDPLLRGPSFTLRGGVMSEGRATLSDRASAPMVGAAVALPLSNRLRLEAGAMVGRRSFQLDALELHRNLALLDLSLEYAMIRRAHTEVGLRLGIGATMDDDVADNDLDFRSSANWWEAAVPGLVLRHALSSRLALAIGVRDYVAGIWNRIVDPSESDLRHDLLFEIGLTIR